MSVFELKTGRLAFPQRLAGAAHALLFLTASLPVGVAYLVALPIAALAGPVALRRMLEFERTLTNRVLGARIPAPPPFTPAAQVEQHQIVFLVAKLPISACAAALCALPAALFAELLVRSVQGLAGSKPLRWPVAAGDGRRVRAAVARGPGLRPVCWRSVCGWLADVTREPAWA